jgi:hypothetical protein
MASICLFYYLFQITGNIALLKIYSLKTVMCMASYIGCREAPRKGNMGVNQEVGEEI